MTARLVLSVAALFLLGQDLPQAVSSEGKGEPTDRVIRLTLPGSPPGGARPTTPSTGAGIVDRTDAVTCANLIYAGSKTSVCFSDRFLMRLEQETNIVADRTFRPVKLATEEIYRYPFAIMTGEGTFTLHERERKYLKDYLTRGGFLLASAGCSSADWDRSFRREIKQIFPDKQLVRIPFDHPIYHTVFDIHDLKLSHGGQGMLEGIEHDGKIVLVYSPEGLNDTSNAGGGCCCCGGNEVRNCQEVNVNIITYALTH